MAVAAACAGIAAKLVKFGGASVFRPGTRENALVGFVAVEVVEFAHAIARVFEGNEIGARRRMTFGTGITSPSVVLLPPSRSLASTALDRGGCDSGSWLPQASHKVSAALTIATAVLWFLAPTAPAWKAVVGSKTWRETDLCLD